MVQMRVTGALVVLALLLGGGAGASHAATVYVAGSANDFGTLNLSTGVFTDIGTLNLPVPERIFGMGFGADGKLYGLDSSSLDANLYLINTTNAQVTLEGSINESAVGATTDASGKMYALSNGGNSVFYTLNPPSTTTTVVGATGIASGGLAAVTADGSHFYTTTGSDLYGINTATGAATLIGDTGFTFSSGLFVQSTLYGFNDSAAKAIVTIDTTTGAGTQVGTYSLPNVGEVIYAAAMAPQTGSPTPEPSSFLLFGMAVTGLGVARWRKRKQAAD